MIKNIIYLDEEKMYSLSSQIFEGVTEYILKETNSSHDEKEEQRGPIASGKVLAETMRLGSREIEKRFLHDHALSLFEQRLADLGLISHIDSSVETSASLVLEKPFIRTDAQSIFIDAAKITSLLKSFNAIGEALTHVSQHGEIEGMRKNLLDQINSTKNSQKQADLRKAEKELTDTAKLAKIAGLYQNPKFLEHLALVMEFGYSDQLEMQQYISEHLFSAHLKRQCLRESVDLTIRKYSRITEKNLTILGAVTQSLESPQRPKREFDVEKMTMKEAVANMVNMISDIEGTLSGKAPYEVVIDPIAVYVTL